MHRLPSWPDTEQGATLPETCGRAFTSPSVAVDHASHRPRFEPYNPCLVNTGWQRPCPVTSPGTPLPFSFPRDLGFPKSSGFVFFEFRASSAGARHSPSNYFRVRTGDDSPSVVVIRSLPGEGHS